MNTAGEVRPWLSVKEVQALARDISQSRPFGPNESEAFTLIMLADSSGQDIRRVLNFLVKIRQIETGCWIWDGATTPGGYGKFFMGEHTKAGNRFPDGAHRASYRLFVDPIPEGLELDHLCKTTQCVHPFHLEAVTHQENLMRGNGISSRYAKETHCKHGHKKIPENIYYYNGKAHGCKICMALRDKARPPRSQRKTREDDRP